MSDSDNENTVEENKEQEIADNKTDEEANDAEEVNAEEEEDENGEEVNDAEEVNAEEEEKEGEEDENAEEVNDDADEVNDDAEEVNDDAEEADNINEENDEVNDEVNDEEVDVKEESGDDEYAEEDEDESDDDTETTEDEIQFFKATIKDYLKIEEEIKVLQKGISQRRKKKNNLSDVILTFLQEKDISHVNLQGNFAGKQMKCNQKVSRAKLSDGEIRNVFNEFFKDDELGDNKVEQLMDIMESKKKVKEVSKLEINKVGGRKKKNASEQLSNIISDNSDANEDTDAIPEHLQYLYNT
jgi:hypothetical protein